MPDFTYNNVRNASTGYTFFELNYKYYPSVFYEKKEIFDPYSKLKIAEKLSFKL